MRKLATLTATAALILGLTSVAQAEPPPHSGGAQSDFALLDEEPTVNDQSVQCGAYKELDGDPDAIDGDDLPAAFRVFITMGNRDDSGFPGTDGFVRVTYADSDFVDYAIPVGTTLNLSLAGGGTLGVDELITVTSGGGALLIGQMSIYLDSQSPKIVPHPSLEFFCTTTLPECSDGIDNDLDTDTDFPADSDCTSAADNDESS